MQALPDVGTLTVAQLQEALKARGLDTKWSPLKGKKELVDRLQVRSQQDVDRFQLLNRRV